MLNTRSPAKINLALSVSRRRDDGYHDIDSVVVVVNLHDDLEVEATSDDSISLSCDAENLDAGESNLVIQAAQALRRHVGGTPGARITLHKRIPMAAGLGGGSGNAATTLRALNKVWGLNLPEDELQRIGAAIGSDVSLFFALPSARIRGRGEIVESLRLRWSGWVVLAFAAGHVSTADVYAAWTPGDRSAVIPDRAERIARASTADELAGLCVNDLEAAVYRVAPIMQTFHSQICDMGAPNARISGAGRTVYALFDQYQDAQAFRTRVLTTELCTGAVVAEVPAVPQPKT